MIHFSIPSQADIDTVAELGAGATFLMANSYFYGLPLCQQILGEPLTSRLYPAQSTEKAGIRFGLHSDAPVGRLRGTLHDLDGIPLVVTYHPAYLLRSPTQKRKAWDDLCLARRVVAEASA